tara:strand:- start:105668 stop:106435 length:768 start_codon:yes stop_codon:yes gene_type:complete
MQPSYSAIASVIAAVTLSAGGCAPSEEAPEQENCERCDDTGEVALAGKPVRFTDQPLGQCWTEENLAVCESLLRFGHAFFSVRAGLGAELVEMQRQSTGRFEAYLSDSDTTLEFVGGGQTPRETDRGPVQYKTVTVDYQPGSEPTTLPGPDMFVIGLVSKFYAQLQLEIVYTINDEEIIESNRVFFLEPEAVLNSNGTLFVHRSYLPIDPGSTVEIDEANGGVCWGIDLDEADWIVVDGCPSVLEPGELETLLDS